MKNYDERIESIFRKYDERLALKKRRKAMIIRRSAALCLGAAAVLGIGIFTNVMKPPKRPTPEQSGIITESSSTVTTSAVTSDETTAVNTTAIATSTKATTSKASNSDVHTSAATKMTAYITVAVTNKTTAATARSTSTIQSDTTSAAATASAMTTVRPAATTRPANTTTGFEPETTAARPQTTATDNESPLSPAETTTRPYPESAVEPTFTTTDPNATTTAYNYDSFLRENFSTLAITDNEIKYRMYLKSVEPKDIGGKIKELTLIPTVPKEQFPRTVNAQVYEIKKISSECAVAVKFEGLSEYRLYRNVYYVPETVGEMLDKLNLYENMSFGIAYVGIEHTQYEFDTDMIWKMLLSDRDAHAVRDFALSGNDIDITVNVPIIGKTGISFLVSRKGYIRTNIIDYGVCFYVGEEKTQAFFDYVLENGRQIN